MRPSKIPRDAKAALVTPGRAHGTYEIKKLLEIPIDIWREVTRHSLHRQHDGGIATFTSNSKGGYSVTRPANIPRDAYAALVKPGRAHGTHGIKKLLEIPIDI